jgi:hypothetical protein
MAVLRSGRIDGRWSEAMDILYCTSLLLRANWRNTGQCFDTGRLCADPAAAPSGAGRLILALAIIVIGAGLLNHVSQRYSDPVATIPPNHLGAVQ